MNNARRKEWVVHQEFGGPAWDRPSWWRVSQLIAETEKTWTRRVGDTDTRRTKLEWIKARGFATEEEARAWRAERVAVEVDVEARSKAVKAEMAEAMRPFQQRLEQLDAEMKDRLR